MSHAAYLDTLLINILQAETLTKFKKLLYAYILARQWLY